MYVPCFESPHSEPVNMFKAKGRFALHLSASQLTAFFIFSLICSLWSPTGVALAQDNNHISVWSSLSSPAKRWNSQVGLQALEYYFVLHSTFIHVVWLMLAISPDETVPQQDMIDGSHIPNPYLHQTLWAIYFCQQPRNSDVPTGVGKTCFFQKYLFALGPFLIPSGVSYTCSPSDHFSLWNERLSACWNSSFEFPVPC